MYTEFWCRNLKRQPWKT